MRAPPSPPGTCAMHIASLLPCTECVSLQRDRKGSCCAVVVLPSLQPLRYPFTSGRDLCLLARMPDCVFISHLSCFLSALSTIACIVAVIGFFLSFSALLMAGYLTMSSSPAPNIMWGTSETLPQVSCCQCAACGEIYMDFTSLV